MPSADKSSSELGSMLDQERGNSEGLAVRVKLLRERSGLTQPELAKKVGLSLSTIQNYESGKFPRGEHAVSLAKALTCSIDWLLTGEESAARSEATPTPAQPLPGSLPGVSFCTDCDVVLIPKVRARLAAGGGSLETNSERVGNYSFRSD